MINYIGHGQPELPPIVVKGPDTVKVVPKVPAEVRINNEDSYFYTIVEVIGEDRSVNWTRA